MLNSTVLFESIAVRGSARPVALLRDVQAECCFCNCLFWRNWGSDNFCDSFGGLLRLENISFLCSTPNAACGFVLSNSLAPSSRIHLKRSAMHSFSVNSMNPFLSAGKMESVAVDECHFENITHKPDAMRRKGLAEERELVGNEIGTIEVESSSFNEVACADFGCIFDGYHTFHHYLSFNCSFVTSRAQANNTRQVNSSGNVVLRDSLFTIVSEVYDGAAVLITGNATLTIERTTFLSCKSTAYSRDNGGGAISATGTGFIIITNSSFNNNSCASNYGGAIRIFSKSAGDVSIEDSTFIENEGPHYGAFQITGQNDYVIVDSCTFYRNKASTYYGGSICFSSMFCNNSLLSNCLFQESSGRMYAGTFFILCDTEDVNPTEIRFLYFDQNTCGNNKGTDIAIRTTNLTFYVASNFTTCFSTSLEKRIVFCTNVSEWECAAYEPRENWIQSANTSSIHVDPLKEDNVVCGNVGRECKTIGFAITRWLQPERQKVHVSRVNHLETSIAINGQTVETSIKGSGDRPTITSKNLDGWLVTIATGSFTVTDFSIVVDTGVSLESSLFLVSNAEGKLNLVQCEISADSTNRMLEHSQFSLLGGSVNLTLCEIRGFSLRECGLFQKESASSLLFEGGSVCDIARSRGNGTIIGKTLGDGEILAISNITFRNCTSSAENGGAFGLCLGSGSQLRIGQTSEVGFEECSAPNSENKGKGGALYLLFDQGANDFILKSISFRGCRAWKGKNVFVDGSNLSSLVKASSFAFKPQTGVELADLDELSGYDAGDRSKVIPLVLYLRTFSSPAYVSGSESDADDTFCGYKDYPCRTVEGAAAFRFANSACELSLLPSFAFLKELTLASQSYVFGAASQGQATEVGSSSVKSREMLVSVSVPATFANITFLLNHSIGNRASFISLQSATLSLTSCSIGKTSETESIEYTAVMASGGVLTVNLLSVAADQALSFSAPMLLLSGSVVCNLFCANLSSIATTGPQSFVETSSSGLANITNCSFGGFSLAKRGVIHSENGGSLYVGCSSFADVSLSSGNGSCIDFAAGEDVLHCVTVFNCSFQGCSVLNDGQSGGGIFASLKSSCKLLINSTSFLSCTAPSEMQSGFGGGISLFVLQTDASFAIDAPSFSDELPNKAKCGNDIFVSSPDLASSVNRESFCFYDEQNPFSAASCVGVDEKWEILMIPLVCYFRVLGDAVCVSAEGSDVPVCGYIDFGCRTLDFSFARLPERKKAVTILNEYAVGESCVLSDAKGYGISGLETKTRLKMEGNETQATSVMEVRAAVFFSCFFIEMVSSLHSTKSAVFSVADSNGVLEIENCECQPESGVSSISYCLFATKAGKLAVNGFVMSNVQFSAGAAVAVNESGACEIVNMIFENVTSSANGKIMKYSSTGEMNVNKSHFSSSMASASPMIFDGNGAVLCVSNTTFSEIGRSEGQGGAVEGVVGDGCRMVLEEVVFLDCCTVDGCGGGLGLSVSGTGHLEIGKEELNSVFKSCAAKKGNGNGGKGGGIFIGFSGEVFDYVICHTIFGAETEKNEAEEKGENIFIEGDDLSRIVTQRRFAVECDVSKEKHNEFVGFDRNADKHVPLASFLSNWTSPVFVNSEEGADYQSCGFSWYPCSSIVYAAENRFAGGVAAVCLEPNFSIADKLVLSAMPMVINGVSKPERVNIAADGRESGDGFVITQNEVTISWLEFCAPCEFLHVQRKSLVLCAGSKLVVEGCSMVMQSGNPSYRFLLITSGSVKLTEFNLNSIEFKEAPAIELVGAQTSGVFDKLHLESVNTTCESGGVIFVSSALAAQIENSTINSTSLLRQTAICVKGGASLTLKKSNFSEVNRTEGNGGVVVGEVDSEKRIEIKECNFAKVMCYHTGTKGGSMLISVAKRGTFLFEKNCVNESRVPGIDGLGGGLHLTFSDVDLTYSMKSDEFNNNDALLGKDVYLVCPLPRRMINPLLWSGSAKDGSEFEKTMWVLDPSDAEMNMSLLRFLFPSVDDIVFVDDGLGQVEAGCGSSVKPCKELSFGFTQLGTEKNILHITSSAKLEGEIKQNLSSLTIRGESVKSDMIVDGGGCICVSDGDLSTQLTIQNVRFAFATSAESPQDALIVGKVGSIFLISCDVSKSADALISSIKQSILCGKGSTITLTSVTFSELVFEADQAICAMQSGSLIISGCTFASICTSKKSLIGGMEGTCVAINNTQISECSSESGSVVHWENALEVEIANTSSFAKCSSEKDNGGAVNLIFSRNYRLSIADVSFSNNSADEKAKNGGAIFVQLSQDLDEAIEFSSLHFLGNKAHHGKDMFVACADLNRTVLQSRFQFHLVNEEGELIVDLFGRDEVITSKEAVNLTLFLLQLQSSSIHVSAAGHDYLGCGSDEYPCNTFWRGYTNMDKTGSDQKLLTVDASTVVQDTYDVSSFSIIPGYGSARSSIVVKSDLELCTLDSIFLSAKSLSIQNMLLSLPTSFAPPVQNLLRLNPPRASEAQLAVKGCVFECSSGSCIDYILISSAKGRVELADCTLPSFSSGVIPLDLSSSVLIKGMNFTNIASASSGEGGVAKVELTEEESLSINGTTAEGCSCARNGRGGAFFVKCSGSLLPAPFVFGSEIILADNEAMIGKNVFVASSDLNRTVTKSTFVFLAEKAKMEHTLFCGSDAVHRDTDLLRFLCGYKNNTIFVSSNGFDIARCGSEDDPCESFWKGMAQIERSSPSKVITVDGSTFVRDAFIVSNYTIASYSASPDEARKAVVGFQNKRINDGEPFLTNAVRLSLERMSLRVAEHFDGSASSIVHSKEGILLVRMCSFESKGLMEDLSKVQFVTVEGGELAVDDLTMSSSNFAENIFAVNNMAQLCTFTSLSVSSLNLSDGSIFSLSSSIGQETKQNSNWRCDFRINESTFSSIARVDDGTGVVFSGINNIDLKVDKTVFSDVKAERSMKGGVMLVSLLSEGSFKMSDSTVTRCCCSSNGKGGGVYLAAATAGKLDFLFSRVNFTANTAFVGNDIFIECHNITAQINETQFGFDVEKVTDKAKAIFGIDKTDHSADTNLLDFITIYRADTIIVSSDPSRNGKDDRQCGTQYLPCLSIDYGLLHLSNNFVSQMFVDKASYLGGEAKMVEMGLTSRTKAQCVIEVHSSIPQHELALISTAGSVSLSYLRFAFAEEFVSLHSAFLCPETGVLELSCCAFTSESYDSAKTVPFCLISANGCKCTAYEVSVSFLAFASPMFHVASSGNMKITSSSFSESSFEGSLAECGEDSVVQTVSSSFTSINVSGRHPMLSFNGANEVAFENCSFISCLSCTQRGSIVSLSLCTNATIDKCLFDGWKGDNKSDEKRNTQPEEICRWNGSLVDFAGTRAAMKDTAIVNSSEGGMSICGGEVSVEKGEYYGNSKAIDGFPSARRNIICESKGQLAMESLKGGDGLLPNTSLWILNEGCELSGMASERASELFIPALERVETEEKGARTELTFRGNLLLPCNLSCQITSTIEEVSSIEVYLLEEDGFVCENEARSSITSGIISSAEERAEVAVCILFGNPEKKERTESFVVKNKTEKKREEDGNNEIVKSERNKGKSSWAAIIAIIFVVLFLIVLIALVIFIVRWKKQKKRTEELEVIVEDTVKKDPKAFEMVTMELSPEEQWRRDEREAEKKNEERVKKRVYEKSLGHSESSEHLLSESGSTEYILGKDSDKIPDWALEKVEEEEETRKRSPSPSISSTSTTSTTDSDSTFVRGEDMCPTTSSMSNLVDAMDCSSPHEKLILDLRDSFFMLMHGRNKTKEMAIGSVEEREVTGAQVLFWVANLALHSFDEMSNPLSSLENLSPHIVLFSEHMDIAIALHSDCSSSSEDSDSSSISSLTIVSSSSSNVSVMSERFTDSPPPSSAFEDCEDNRDECKRWKAPELLMNRKMCATKQSVAFSIGMMLWECVTLEIPFGEYEAGIAGDKIVKGERPRLDVVEDTTYGKLIGVCLSPGWEGRPMLSELKKEFFVHFPAEAKMLTVSDAIGVEEEEGGRNEHSGGEGSSMVDDGGNGNDVGNGDEEGDAKTTR